MGALWFWIAYAGAGALCVLLAWLGARRRQLRPLDLRRDAAAVECARCGYDVRGLPGTICPECGSDLEQVGRVTPQFRRWQKLPPVLRGVVWSVSVLLMGVLMLFMALLNGMPVRASFVSTDVLYPLPEVMPAAERRLYVQRYEQVSERSLTGIAADGSNPTNSEHASVKIFEVIAGSQMQQGRDTGVQMTFDTRSKHWELRNGDEVVETGDGVPAPEVALQFVELGRAGSGAMPSTNPAEAARRNVIEAGTVYLRFFIVGRDKNQPKQPLHLLLPERWREGVPLQAYFPTWPAQEPQGNLLVLSSGVSTSRRVAWKWFIPAGFFWLLVWLVGFPLVFRRRKVLAMRDAAPLQAASIS